MRTSAVGILDDHAPPGHPGSAARRHPLVERRLSPDELRGADEAFITSATRGVLPVTTIDERPVASGAPGPVTRRLMSLYDALARRGVP